MRLYTRIWGSLVWLSTALMLFLQLKVVIGLLVPYKKFDVTLIIIAAAMMLASVIAVFAMKKHKWIPLVLSLAASALFVVIAVMIADKYLAGSNWVDTWGYITSGQLVFRHLTPLLIPLFMAGYLVCWYHHKQENAAALAPKKKEKVKSTIGLDMDGDA